MAWFTHSLLHTQMRLTLRNKHLSKTFTSLFWKQDSFIQPNPKTEVFPHVRLQYLCADNYFDTLAHKSCCTLSWGNPPVWKSLTVPYFLLVLGVWGWTDLPWAAHSTDSLSGHCEETERGLKLDPFTTKVFYVLWICRFATGVISHFVCLDQNDIIAFLSCSTFNLLWLTT